MSGNQPGQTFDFEQFRADVEKVFVPFTAQLREWARQVETDLGEVARKLKKAAGE